MKIDKNYFHIFFLLLFSAMFLFGAGRLGIFAYEKAFAGEDRFVTGTSIGPISVEGLTVAEAQQQLQAETAHYQNTTKFTLSYSDEKVTIPLENIHVAVEDSIARTVNGEQNVLMTEVREQELHKWISQIIPDDLFEAINVERLKEEIEATVGRLESGKMNFPLYSFLEGIAPQVLSQASISTGVIDELAEGITIEVEPYERFSFLNDFASRHQEWSDERLTLIASALYEASLATNVEIIERQVSNEQPAKIPLGFEAKIKRESIDFVMENRNDFPLNLHFQVNQSGVMTVSISGFPLSKKYEVVLSEPISHDYRQIVQYSPYLQRGQETVKVQGINGVSITVQRDIYDRSGEQIEREEISKDFYLPVHQIMTKSILAEVEEEVLDENPSVEQNEQEIEDEAEEKDQEEETTEENNEQEEETITEASEG